MKATLLLLSLFICVASFAEEPPKWAQMQSAIVVGPDLSKVKRLVETGVDPNAPIGCGTFAPLDGAVQQGNPDLVDLLISLGAKPTENQIVHAAFCSNHDAALKIVTSLHAAGASINAKEHYSEDRNRYTMPLHNAVWRHNTELIAYLLKQKAIILDDTNIDGFTPLMIAVEHGRTDIVDMLLAAGANPLKKNSDGLDAASVADKVIEIQTRLKKKMTEQGSPPNHHAFGTFGTSPAEQALVPKAGGDR